MCGRYVILGPAGRLMDAFELLEMPGLEDRYNVAPQTDVPVIRQRAGIGRVAESMRWGLVPGWAKDPSIGAKQINARAETVASRPSWRSAFRRARCIVPASGFYEWQARPGGARKQPWYMHPTDRPYFAMAGLMERWQGPEGSLRSCAIITCEANALMTPIHERMPCILAPEDYDRWLDPGFDDLEALQGMLRPADPARMATRAVGFACGNARNEGPALIEPLSSNASSDNA